MKESEVKEAVDLARDYLRCKNSLGYFEIDILCRALVALDEDNVCEDDDDDEPVYPVVGELGARLERHMPTCTTTEDVETAWPPWGAPVAVPGKFRLAVVWAIFRRAFNLGAR